MMQCRGMGAVTKKGNKPKVMAKGKKVPGKVKGYAQGMPIQPAAPEPKPINPGDPRRVDYDPGRQNYNRMMERMDARRQAVVNNRMNGGPRMAKGKTVKRKMKGKKV